MSSFLKLCKSYPFGMLMPGRYLSDTTARCQTITQTRFFTTYVDSCWTVPGWPLWNPWVIRIGSATVTPAGTAIQAVLPDPSSMFYISRTAVPSAINHVSLLVESVSNPVVISVVETVDGQEVVLGEQLLQAAQMSTVSFSITPSTPSIRIRVRWFTAPAILRWRTICVQVPQMQSETYLVDVCDEIGDKYRFGFGNHEKLNEISGIGNTIDMGDRWLDTRLGRTPKLDKATKEYPSISPYAYVMNTPIWAKDPDGKRVYFVGGAGNDPVSQGWNYINRFKCIWTNLGIEDFMRVNVTYGKTGDMFFVENYRNNSRRPIGVGYKHAGWIPVTTEKQLQRAVNGIVDDITSRPLKKGEQLNMAGYSYGAVLQAHATVELIKKGYKVDNLILIASPTSDNSDLMKTLQQYKKDGKLGNIIRKDIEGDDLSNPDGLRQYLNGIKQGAVEGDDAHHFDMARPGEEADKKIEQTGKELQQNGVK